MGKLIHSRVDLHRGRARHGTEVGDTFDSRNSLIQIDAGSGERADVLSHLAEVVDRHVGVMVQLIESRIDVVERRALRLRIGENGLHRLDLELVFMKTVNDSIRSERRSQIFAGVERHVGDISKHRCCCYLECCKLELNRLGTFRKRRKIYILSSLIDFVKSLTSIFEVKRLLKFINSTDRLIGISFKIAIIELHSDNALVDLAAHTLVTSFQASSASSSNMG